MVNVCFPEQRSLCFSNVCVLGLKRGLRRERVLCGPRGGGSAGPAPSGQSPGFADVRVWLPARIHVIISKKETFTFVRIIIHKVLSLIIPLSVSRTPWNLHNNRTSKPEPFTGRKVFPLYYFVAK